MSEEIIKVLDKLVEKFGIAIDWTSQNVLPYLQELFGRYAKYFVTSCVIWLIAEIILLIASIIVLIGGLKEKEKYNKGNKDPYLGWSWIDEGIGRFLFLIISTIVLAITIPITVQSLLKGIYMPELIFINAIGGIK